MRLQQTPPDPRTARWYNLLMGALYLFSAALLIYFRLGPVRRVLDRLGGEGAESSSWGPTAFNVITLAAIAYLIWQGLRSLRRTLGRPAPPENDSGP